MVVAVLVTGTVFPARERIIAEDGSSDLKAFHVRPVLPSPTGAPGAPNRLGEPTVISEPIAVTVGGILVSAGDRVAAGDPLMELADVQAERDTDRLTAEVGRTNRQIVELESELQLLDQSFRSQALDVARRQADLTNAQRTADQIPARRQRHSLAQLQRAYEDAIERERRITEQLGPGAAGLQSLEEAQVAVRVAAEEFVIERRMEAAQAAVDDAQLELARVQAQLALTEQQRARLESELAAANRRLSQTESALRAVSSRPDRWTVFAPAGAIVMEVMVRTGEHVRARTPLLKLVPVSP